MNLWVVIPVKPLNRAKSRLQNVLLPEQRARLAEAMFTQLLSIVTKANRVTGVLVISRDSKAIAIARDWGAKTILESGSSGLNPALTRATEVARVWGAGAVLVLPADLPFIQEDDIRRMIAMANEYPCVVIAPDQTRYGTNALLVRPPGLFEYEFGARSFNRHRFIADQHGATVKIYQSERLAIDIDVPEDLVMYNRLVAMGDYGHLPVFDAYQTSKACSS